MDCCFDSHNVCTAVYVAIRLSCSNASVCRSCHKRMTWCINSSSFTRWGFHGTQCPLFLSSKMNPEITEVFQNLKYSLFSSKRNPNPHNWTFLWREMIFRCNFLGTKTCESGLQYKALDMPKNWIMAYFFISLTKTSGHLKSIYSNNWMTWSTILFLFNVISE